MYLPHRTPCHVDLKINECFTSVALMGAHSFLQIPQTETRKLLRGQLSTPEVDLSLMPANKATQADASPPSKMEMIRTIDFPTIRGYWSRWAISVLLQRWWRSVNIGINKTETNLGKSTVT